MTANTELYPTKDWPYLRGFANLFRKEHQAWWRTRRWWINAVLWSGMLGGLVGVMLFMVPAVAELTGDPGVVAAGGPVAFGLQMGGTVFFEMGMMALAIGAIVLCMDLIVDERKSGVAEWLLSKPVARRAYILAKLVASVVAIMVLLVGLPALITYILLSLRSGSAFMVWPYLRGVGIMAVHTMFYLTLTLMLGAMFSSRPPILGVAFASLMGGNLLTTLVEDLIYVTPWFLPKTASLVVDSQPVPADLVWMPIMASIVWSVLFITAAVFSFEKAEF